MSPTAKPAPLLGSYEIRSKLGAGGMAEVFLASHQMSAGLQRPVVIKAMLPHLAEDPRFVEMFMREARVAALLSHPNLVHIHDVSVLDGRPCIVMEFLRGRDLWQLLRRTSEGGGRLAPTAAAAIVSQAASGLAYAHRKRDEAGNPLHLVHRDISPHNIFVTREGHVCVLDFGIAKSAYQQQRTESGVLKGKLPYMAPEQARGKKIDGRVDIFALGVVLWECMTGERLFARDDPFQTMTALFELDVAPPSQVVPGIPEEIDHICFRALAADREERYSTCSDLASALRGWLRVASDEEETLLVARAIERAIPAVEDAEFYGFDVSSTDPKVDLIHHAMAGIEDEETVQRQREGTPSTSGVAPTPLARSIARDKARDAGRERATLLTTGAVLGLLLLFGLAFGVVFATWMGAGERESRAGKAPLLTGTGGASGQGGAEAVERTEITVRFVGLPDDVTVEVNGMALSSHAFRTVASTETRAIRALRNGREVWRYDAVFRESTDVEVPELGALPVGADQGQ